ncbi:MAG: hypothetical protein AB8F74_00195 [Saprospiraceae bacterium]
MNPFEKEFKDRFQNAHSTDGVDSDAIWGSISEALPQEEEKPKGIFFRYGKYFLLALAGLLVAGLGLYFTWGSEMVDIAENKSVETSINKDLVFQNKKENTERVSEGNNNNKGSETPPAKDDDREIVKLKDNLDLKNTLKNNSNKAIAKKSTEEQLIKLEDGNNLTEDLINISNITEEIIKTIAEDQTNEIANKKNKVNNSTEKEETKSVTEKATEQTDLKEPILFNSKNISLYTMYDELPFVVLNNDFNINADPVIPKTKKGRNRKIQIGLFAGVVNWSSNYKNNNNSAVINALDKSASSAYGQSLSVLLQWNFSKKIHLTTGLEYMNAKTRFDYVSTKDSFAIVDGYQQLGPIDAIATRTVRHHNTLQVFSLPILFGTHKNVGAFELGVDAGVGLNYIISQEGRTLDSELTIADFNSTDNNTLPYRDFYLSYQLQPYLSYSATERIKLQLRPNFRYQHHGNSKLHDIEMSSLLWGVNVGAMLGF